MIGLQKDQLNPVHQNIVMGKFHTYGLLTALVEFTLLYYLQGITHSLHLPPWMVG